MRRAAVFIVACALAVVPVAGAQAATTHYRSCVQMHQDYKWGVARNPTASRAIVTAGNYRPKTSKRLYAANKKLDKDRDGVICPVKKATTPTPASTPASDPFVIPAEAGIATVDADLRTEIGAGQMSEQQFRYLWTILYASRKSDAERSPGLCGSREQGGPARDEHHGSQAGSLRARRVVPGLGHRVADPVPADDVLGQGVHCRVGRRPTRRHRQVGCSG